MRLSWTATRCALALALASAMAARAGTSTAVSPVVTFGSPGAKVVSLQVCNIHGCTTTTRTVTVLDPSPGVTVFNVGPDTVTQGDVVHLAGAGQGAPPLTYRWRVVAADGTPRLTLFGAAVDWPTGAFLPGAYLVYLDVINSAGTATIHFPASVTVQAGPLLFSDGFEVGLQVWKATP